MLGRIYGPSVLLRAEEVSTAGITDIRSFMSKLRALRIASICGISARSSPQQSHLHAAANMQTRTKAHALPHACNVMPSADVTGGTRAVPLRGRYQYAVPRTPCRVFYRAFASPVPWRRAPPSLTQQPNPHPLVLLASLSPWFLPLRLCLSVFSCLVSRPQRHALSSWTVSFCLRFKAFSQPVRACK